MLAMAQRLEVSESIQEHTEPLFPSDYLRIGEFIQAFAIGDFYARRLIESTRLLNDIAEPFAGTLNDTDSLEHFERTVKSLNNEPEIVGELLKIISTLKMHRRVRHIFAHWAGQRTINPSLLCFYTHNSKEAKKFKGDDLLVGSTGFVLISPDDIEKELEKLKSNADALGKISHIFEEKYPQINERRMREKSISISRFESDNGRT